jgi:ergothioneine biosynthesis protein EgtC
MCRLVAYLGKPIRLERVISEPEHSLVVQSYRPAEMTSGVVNADGFGVGWYNRALDATPCVYKSPSPIWGDQNLSALSHHIASECIVANVRSATPGQAVDHSNCQPFSFGPLLFMHNGYIENFRSILMRQMRDVLHDDYYAAIAGSTDSEHIFALLLHFLHGRPLSLQTMATAIAETSDQLLQWATAKGIHLALNLVLTNGEYVITSRYASKPPAPSLYYTINNALFPQAAVIASERLSVSPDWSVVPEGSIVAFDAQLNFHRYNLRTRVAA